MTNIIRIIASSIILLWSFSAKAEFQYGIGGLFGQVSTDGTETEGTAADTSDRSKSFEELFVGADLFVEFISDSYTIGLSYVPFDVELGSGSRTDNNGDDPAENDDGTRTASADLTDFYTLYANIPFGGGGMYTLLGYHFATVETAETLNESSYGNVDVEGYQIGIGSRSGNIKYELSYSDFENIKINSTGGGTNSVSADADTVQFRVSYGF